MKKRIFEGSAVAMVTPFKENGVDFDKLQELIEFQIEEGTDAIVVCGTTGETPTLSESEHLGTIKFMVEQVNKRIPVIAGTGSNDTMHAVKLSKEADNLGVDGILCVTPYYNKTSQRGLYEHFKLISSSVKVPIILYNVPSRTNLNINPDTVKALCDFENIVAIKECNLSQVGDIINLCGPNFTIYSGNDDQVLPLLSYGGKGVISVMANVIPKDTHDLVHKYLQGDIDGSRELQLKVLNLIKALFSDVSPIPVKAAMNLMGMNVGNCRMPLVNMSGNNLQILKKELENYGLLK